MKNSEVKTEAYGFMYLDKVNCSTDQLSDVSNNSGLFISRNSSFLPMSYLTWDPFFAYGDACNASIRIYRNDAGLTYDPEFSDLSLSTSKTKEEAWGIVHHKMQGSDMIASIEKTGGETDAGHTLKSFLSFRHTQNNSDYEPFYMKAAGENTMGNNDLYTKFGNDAPMYCPISIVSGQMMATGGFISQDKQYGMPNTIPRPENNLNERRVPRSEYYALKSAEKASITSLNKEITVFPYNQLLSSGNTSQTPQSQNRVSGYRKEYHISEIEVTRDDGSRLVYGIPVYVINNREVTFAVSGNGHNPIASESVIPFRAGIDNTTGNTCGRNGYFSARQIAPYAQHFLLTTVLSSDYADRTGNGVSDDDPGQWIKLNYTEDPYPIRQRFPFSRTYPTAFFNSGKTCDPLDNTGSYQYQESERWYLQSIESETYIAEFYLSDRLDGYEISTENSSIDQSGSRKKKLDQIKIFEKNDRINNGSRAIPLKTIHFEYDYSLCQGFPGYFNPGTPAEKGGKLTLRKVWTTYGTSEEGTETPFLFKYEGSNLPYEYGKTNMWNKYCTTHIAGELSENQWFCPEEEENEGNSWSWDITGITLPAGGELKLAYEDDEYCYVQDEKAMNLFKIAKISCFPASGMPASNDLYSDPASVNAHSPSVFVYFENQDSTSIALLREGKASEATKRIKDLYATRSNGSTLKYLYFRVFADMRNEHRIEDFDYVTGYAEVTGVGIDPSSSGNLCWIKINSVPETVEKSNCDVSQICKTVWQHARTETPEILWKAASDEAISKLDKEVRKKKRTGVNRILQEEGFGKYFVPGLSYIRLFNAGKSKKGGGNRVKRITFYDKWDAMSGNPASWVGVEYIYDFYEKNEMKSRGVASSEPYTGREVNPLLYPVYDESYHNKDIIYFEEYPNNLDILPAPQVGYSKVIMRNTSGKLNEHYPNGSVTYEYYTSRDYPVKNYHTSVAARMISNDESPDNGGNRFFNRMVGLSQGYSIIRNDMHGRPKAIAIWEEGMDYPVRKNSTVFYYRNICPEGTDQNHNLCRHQFVNPVLKMISSNTDISFHLKNYRKLVNGITIQSTNDVGIGTTLIGGSSNSSSSANTEFNELFTIVCTKITDQSVILDSIVSYSDGIKSKSCVESFDETTGFPLLASTTNEYNKPVYGFSYPAGWTNREAEAGWISSGFSTSPCISDHDYIKIPVQVNADSLFSRGDEILITTSGTSIIAWTAIVNVQNNSILCIDRDGAIIHLNEPATIEIVRSGRKNLHHLNSGFLASLGKPLNAMTGIGATANNLIVTTSGVLSAG
ncbi:MAG: hypothetical protein KKA07_11260, partial [Bacteroidetes bacterium]|nr:hypothetical protein [Bacteroidota bacterium]